MSRNDTSRQIKFVAQHVKSIREFGRQLRELAMEQLLTALAERNQAYVAASLQVRTDDTWSD